MEMAMNKWIYIFDREIPFKRRTIMYYISIDNACCWASFSSLDGCNSPDSFRFNLKHCYHLLFEMATFVLFNFNF